MINTADTIRECRRFRKLTQVELADKSGISRQTIWNVENGSNTSVSTFESLLNAMGLGLEIVPLRREKDWRLP